LFGNSNKQGLIIPSFFHHRHQALTSCPGKIITTLKPTNLFLFCQQESETLCHAPPEQAKVNLISVLNKRYLSSFCKAKDQAQDVHLDCLFPSSFGL